MYNAERLTLFKADLCKPGSFDQAMRGVCSSCLLIVCMVLVHRVCSSCLLTVHYIYYIAEYIAPHYYYMHCP